MSEGKIRSVIYDGESLCQHCIFIGEDIIKLYNDGLLNKYAVIRLDDYTVSPLSKKENLPIIVVQKIALIIQGLCLFTLLVYLLLFVVDNCISLM